MSRLKCTCGNSLGNSDVPSKNIINVFKRTDVQLALEQTPAISLFDFETSGREEFEYWYCPECKRVHVVENAPNGKVAKTYKPSGDEDCVATKNMTAVYIFTAMEIYEAEENNFQIILADYIEQNEKEHLYYLNPDKNKVYREIGDSMGCLVYEKEDNNLSKE